MALGEGCPDRKAVVLGAGPAAEVAQVTIGLRSDATEHVGYLSGDELLHWAPAILILLRHFSPGKRGYRLRQTL